MRYRHILLLLVLLTCWIVAEKKQCSRGWFGPECQYKCRCTDDKCDRTGLCPDGAECQGGWFGPACQYADIAFHRSTIWEVTDGNDGTCVNDPSLLRLDVAVDDILTWFRIKWRIPGFMISTKMMFLMVSGDILGCPMLKQVFVDNRTADILCSYDDKVAEMALAGPGVAYLCSVYISGGRNVALKQSTSQSTTYIELSEKTNLSRWDFPSHLAVDGNQNPHFYSGRSCAATFAQAASQSAWFLKFSREYLVSKYVLYYSVDANDIYTPGSQMALYSFNSAGIQVMDYVDSLAAPHAKTETYHPLMKVSELIIVINLPRQSLTLCEVEVYGDSICDSGHFGRDCEFECNCFEVESCLISTGGCVSGCAIGYRGEDCKMPCDVGTYGYQCLQNCNHLCFKDGQGNRPCDTVTGECVFGCEDGYQTPYCQGVCDVGLYGPACSLPCSTKCVAPFNISQSPCTHGNGTCLYGCTNGYKGPTCTTKCDSGTYGEGCKLKCSAQCLLDNEPFMSPCHYITGLCLHGCNAGYEGMICNQACGLETYGMHCQNNCSEFCHKMNKSNSRCDHVTGECITGCDDGYLPPKCDMRVDFNNLTMTSASSPALYRIIVLGSICAIGILILLTIMLLSIKKSEEVDEEEEMLELESP